MPDLNVIMQWMERYPRTGWGLLLLYLVAGVVRRRMINAEPGSVFRGLLNFRQRRLERMLNQAYLKKKDLRLVRRELRQRSLYQLTGIFEHRLQDMAVALCEGNDRRAGYLRHWRGWLKAHQGNIIFDRRIYAFHYCLSVTGTVLMTAVLFSMCQVFTEHQGFEGLYVFLMINIALWWFPLLLLITVPSPKMTDEMEALVARFNREEHAL